MSNDVARGLASQRCKNVEKKIEEGVAHRLSLALAKSGEACPKQRNDQIRKSERNTNDSARIATVVDCWI